MGGGGSREGARQAKWFIETQTSKGTSPCKKKKTSNEDAKQKTDHHHLHIL